MSQTRGFHCPRYRYNICKVTAHGGVWSAYSAYIPRAQHAEHLEDGPRGEYESRNRVYRSVTTDTGGYVKGK
eukprot:652143-Pyramimonas_sp.AAC.3